MSLKPNGELVPEGGGDNIPLIRPTLTIGRRESCDICLRYSSVSGKHCQLQFLDEFWWILDLGSTNGLKVNGVRAPKKLLHPGDKITIGEKTFTIEYQPPVGKHAMEDLLENMEGADILSQPLLERAGLLNPPQRHKRPAATEFFDPAKLLKTGEEKDETGPQAAG
jgi:pSer/pThr/pTyr-binding forkhead associated (FHA) protein